ncbi:MAG: hypothetical protein ACI4UK_08365 [Floccifex sp.]
MKVAIVCAFDTYFERVKTIKKYYEEKGNEVIVVSSSFSHRKKEKLVSDLVDVTIRVCSYQRNLSIERLQNHYEFAQKTKQKMKDICPDVIHCMIPCNSLCKTMSEYKKENNVKLIFDVLDLWPETMPIHHFKNHFPFTLWKNMRDSYIQNADFVFTECDLFKEKLKLDSNCQTLYWTKEDSLPSHVALNEDLEICYLGSINHIIDIPFIVQFLKECSLYKKVRLHIIGNGENKKELISSCLENGINVVDYKEIYDAKTKKEIFDHCHYALNIMKPSVVVGLTMKSLDYLWAGLPLINTIQGDTYSFVDQYNLGWNIDILNYKHMAYCICEENRSFQMERRQNCLDIYKKYFTYNSLKKTMDDMYETILYNR